jgi:predicted AlkP superfamily phosphohydrolase/phosphomutase
MTAARTVVVGLDGCSWNVLDALLQTGKLPHLTAIRESGASGTLESVVPFYTGPAWSSYATGASPGRHGVYDFLMLREDGRLSPASSSDLRRKTYYGLLGEQGRPSVVVNLPLEQQDVPGSVIVNSWLTVDEARRIFPLALRARYERELESYRNYPTTFELPLDRHLDDLCELEASRFELVKALFSNEEWEHFFVLFSAPDWLGHKATGLFLRGEPAARAAFERLYSQLDRYVGWLRENAGEDAVFAVISDHGQCEEVYAVHVNGILRDLGHVQLRNEAGMPGGGRRTVHLPRFVGPLRRSRAMRGAARRAMRLLGRTGVELLTPAAGAEVDRAASRAFTPTVASYAVYADEAVDLLEICDRLRDQRLDDGRAAFDGVWTFEELYGAERTPGAPAILFAPTAGVRPSIAARTPFVTRVREPGRGAHQRDGIILLCGEGVAPGDLDRPVLFDLCPTLLWAMNAPLPAEADGRVLFEAFTSEFAAGREPTFTDTRVAPDSDGGGALEDVVVEERLRALGYI